MNHYIFDEKEISIDFDGKKIYGKAFIPRTEKKVPLVIFSHELTQTHKTGKGYAQNLAVRGIAVYTFDYRGGSVDSKSDGKTTEMSILTESADLEKVFLTAKTWDFVDSSKILILGGSQGGLVAAHVAAKFSADLLGLILLYPAFIIPDSIHADFKNLEEIPEEYSYRGWIQVGKIYATDAWSFDPYSEMKNFKKPVLILHGDKDSAVDVSYSKKAVENYPDAELKIFEGSEHLFETEKDFNDAINYILPFLEKIKMFA